MKLTAESVKRRLQRQKESSRAKGAGRMPVRPVVPGGSRYDGRIPPEHQGKGQRGAPRGAAPGEKYGDMSEFRKNPVLNNKGPIKSPQTSGPVAKSPLTQGPPVNSQDAKQRAMDMLQVKRSKGWSKVAALKNNNKKSAGSFGKNKQGVYW